MGLLVNVYLPAERIAGHWHIQDAGHTNVRLNLVTKTKS